MKQDRREFLKQVAAATLAGAGGLGSAPGERGQTAGGTALAGPEAARTRARELARRLHDPRLMAPGRRHVYAGEDLTAIRFGVGGIGAGTIQMDGHAQRAIWQIFDNFAAGVVPHSFFAVSVAPAPETGGLAGGEPVTRVLQTTRAGSFEAMPSVRFRGEYPFAWYDFEDPHLPVQVTLEAVSPFIPMRSRESAMPCALFNITLANRTDRALRVRVLATQQNAVGYRGEGAILERSFPGYGGNRVECLVESSAVIAHMTGGKSQSDPAFGDMALVAFDPTAQAICSWTSPDTLLQALSAGAGADAARGAGPSPAGETLDAALVSSADLRPHEAWTARFGLVWHFPNAQNGGEIPGWEHAGNRYAVWWKDALDVSRYLIANVDELTDETRRFHSTFYESNLPRWLLDRVTSQLAVLRSKTCFWAADDFFGAWEGCAPTSGCCAGNCTHVWHYAQAHARLFPDIARRMRAQIYADEKPDGALPHRLPSFPPAADGLLGDILGVYREHLCSADGSWLASIWPGARKAMEYAIRTWDDGEDGVLSGAQWNTLDGALGGSTTWIGSLYLAALAASERMADLMNDPDASRRYARIRASGAAKQDRTLWNGEYYIQRRDPQPRDDYGDGCEIDQLLGEWWSNQLGLPVHYPEDHIRSALASLIKYNFRPDFHGVVQRPRKFVDDNDAGMQMIHWPTDRRPNPTILYGDEVMTGFEYAAAATMIQFGMLREGLMVARAVADRYDGRLRTGLTDAATASWGYSGNPFGDDECGKFYARAMSVWSLLLACQGLVYDGPARKIGFRPVWRPHDHRSFFTTAEAWGLYAQTRRGGRQRSRLEVRWGALPLREAVFTIPGGCAGKLLSARAGGRSEAARAQVQGSEVTIRHEPDVLLRGGDAIEYLIA